MRSNRLAHFWAAKPVRLSLLAALVVWLVPSAMAATPGADVRLTNDNQPGTGYISTYTLATGHPYSDYVLRECSRSRGRENEPAVAVNPRDTRVIIGSSNDYCGVYANPDPAAPPAATGPVWLGYYRSENSGTSFQSSLVPGYPGDTSPYGALARVRTASSGDPVVAWDNHGRVFMGSESSDDPAGSLKTFGDVWVATFDNPGGEAGSTLNDGKRFVGSNIVAHGSSAPNLLGKFNDKTALEVDRTGNPATDGNVYFAYSRFTGNGGVGIYFSRSTDHGATFTHPMKVSAGIHDVQFPDIAVTGNGNVYITFRQFSAQGQQQDAIIYVKSTDGGQTFSAPRTVTGFIPYDAVDVADPQAVPTTTGGPEDPVSEDGPRAPGSLARDCGDFDGHCQSGYTFFRRDTQVRSTADQRDRSHEYVYIVYDPSKPGTQVATGTTYGSIQPGTGSQSGVYFIRLDGASGAHTPETLIDNQATGHQLFPDISADAGVLHALWWDSRNDPNYSPTRPVGNDADGVTGPSLDVYAARANTSDLVWTGQTRVTDVTSNPNYEQFSDRTVPFAGDYLWVSSVGPEFSYGVWTDWRNTVAGVDQREASDEDNDNADVLQCRTYDPQTQTFSSDQCPRAGGLDQDIYGDYTP